MQIQIMWKCSWGEFSWKPYRKSPRNSHSNLVTRNQVTSKSLRGRFFSNLHGHGKVLLLCSHRVIHMWLRTDMWPHNAVKKVTSQWDFNETELCGIIHIIFAPSALSSTFISQITRKHFWDRCLFWVAITNVMAGLFLK